MVVLWFKEPCHGPYIKRFFCEYVILQMLQEVNSKYEKKSLEESLTFNYIATYKLLPPVVHKLANTLCKKIMWRSLLCKITQ